METAVAVSLPPGTEQTEQQEEVLADSQQLLHDSRIHSLDDTEDYGPLKKKLKYRDERDKGKERSGSFSYSTMEAGAGVGAGDSTLVLDSSTEMDEATLRHHAVVASAQSGPDTVAEQDQDQDHHHLPSLTEQVSEETEQADQQQQQQQQHGQAEQEEPQKTNEKHKPKDLAGSPGSVNEKTRKHNFYVPRREIASLLDNISSTPSTTGLPNLSSTSLVTATSLDGVSGAREMSVSEAQAHANALLAIGTSITGRQAAKIAAMEAKEKARIAKEAELEELKLKRKAELERKKLENARKKAERDASLSSTNATPIPSSNSASSNGNMQQRKVKNPSSTSLPLLPQMDASPPPSLLTGTNISTTTASNSKTAANKPKRGNAPRRSNTKPEQESPELPIPPNTAASSSTSFLSPDIKISSPSTSTFYLPSSSKNPNTTQQSSNNDMILPPMPEPAIAEGMIGFIPYASEGARAAALAKAAKQQKANGFPSGGTGSSSTSSSIPISLPTTSKQGGKKGSTSGGSNFNRQYSSGGSNQNKKGKSKALQNITTQNNSNGNSSLLSGRASPSNALEHAAAAIDAVLDAGALARAQAQVEEEEVDDRLYCIVSHLSTFQSPTPTPLLLFLQKGKKSIISFFIIFVATLGCLVYLNSFPLFY